MSITEPSKHWYAVYTRSRHEKAVAEKLDFVSIRNFLPLYTRVSRWKDRRVKLRLPLFPGYLFVNIESSQRIQVLQLPGVLSVVSSLGKPLPMPGEDIERLQQTLANGAQLEPHDYLQIGQRVRVVRGPFEGYEGVLKQKKNKTQIVVSIHQIMRAFALTVSGEDLEVIGPKLTPFALNVSRATDMARHPVATASK
jgi:transcription antitermination factor NusG